MSWRKTSSSLSEAQSPAPSSAPYAEPKSVNDLLAFSFKWEQASLRGLRQRYMPSHTPDGTA